MKRLQGILDGEWIFRFIPNGGTAVLFRTTQLSVFAFLFAIGVDSFLSPSARFAFSTSAFMAALKAHLPWFGVLFGGVYAALYSRFAAQWTYLAGLYNSLMQLECQEPRSTLDHAAKIKRRSMWWAAFVEDAWTMHLATKPAFSNAILGLLGEPLIRAEIDAWGSHMEGDMRRLEKRLTSLVARSGGPKGEPGPTQG